jgi:hypothetical protein
MDAYPKIFARLHFERDDKCTSNASCSVKTNQGLRTCCQVLGRHAERGLVKKYDAITDESRISSAIRWQWLDGKRTKHVAAAGQGGSPQV